MIKDRDWDWEWNRGRDWNWDWHRDRDWDRDMLRIWVGIGIQVETGMVVGFRYG